MTAAFNERNQSIADAYRSGATCGQLGKLHNVSRERICQIIRPLGLIEDRFAARLEKQIGRLEARYAKRQARQELAERMIALVEGGMSWLKAADALSIPRGKIWTLRRFVKSTTESQHGRWRSFDERKERVRQMRAEGKTWEQINASFGRQIYPWVAKHMPELIRGRQ